MSTAPDPEQGFVGIELSALTAYGTQLAAIPGVTFWPRALARIIDLLVHFSVSFAAGMFFSILLFIAAAGHPSRSAFAKLGQFSVTALLMALLGAVAYQAICEGLHGSSLGKLVLSMVVVQDDGSPCRFGSALIRSFAYFLDGLFFGMIAYAAMQNSPEEQRNGDRWAHTVVCKRSNAPPGSLRDGGRFVAAFLLAVMADAAIAMLSLLLKLNG